jgi:hypothetical protein
MRLIRTTPASGKPLRIVCTGCGEKALEAGVAVDESNIEDGSGTTAAIQS